ncbi:MAG: T9SS type A sorting domain-containing protein [Bacteroidota bacterium]|nr:T9SS type A sorting domain-containing protein [Bacteroidota bacterium]
MKKIVSILFLALSYSFYAQPSSFASRGIGGGGALFAVAINPANNNEYYVSCDMGELFHTTNFGTSYNQVNFQQLIGGHNSKVCFTSSVGLLYSISYANNMVQPMKSTDNGVTWSVLPGNPNNTEETFSIDADYNNPQRVIISYYGNIYFSGNGGTTFTSIHTATNTGAGNVVGGVFFDGNNIYIGTNDGVLVSTNGGTSFSTVAITGIPATQRIWSFAGAKVGPITRFFCITADVGDIYVGVVGSDYYQFAKGVYAVDYGAGNWLPKMTGINLTNDFPMFVGMATNDINTVYLAGSNNSSYPDVLKTTNAGTGWSHVFNTTTNQNIITGWSGQGGDRPWSYGECPFGLAVAPNNSQSVIFGDFGFVHKTNNGGTGWSQAYVDPTGQHPANATTPPNTSYQSVGIENTTCWQVEWMSANNMFACFSDIRGIRSTDAGTSWSFNYTGHTANSMYRIAKHPTNGTLYAGTSNIHDMYQSTRLQDNILDATDANGKIIYSTTNGASWQNLEIFNHPVFWVTLDPNNPNRAYASVIHYNGGTGVGGVYVTSDLQNLATSNWTLLPNPPRTEKHPACLVVLNDGKLVATYSGRRTSAGAFTASSGVFIYDPALNSWTDLSPTGMYYWTKDIVLDPNDPLQNTWYVCVFSGWGGAPNGLGGLYKTTNKGLAWTKLTGTTIDRVTSITFNPGNANQIFLTTEGQGLWQSNNINAATPTFSMVQSYPFQQPERVFFNPFNQNEMWVTSFGNGMKVGSLLPTGNFEFKNAAADGIDLFPNPSSDLVTFDAKLNGKFDMVEVFDLTGRLVSKIILNKTESTTTIDVSGFANGVYLAKISQDGQVVSTKKFVVAK